MLDDGKDTLIDLSCRIIAIHFIGQEVVGFALSFILIALILVWEHQKKKRRRAT